MAGEPSSRGPAGNAGRGARATQRTLCPWTPNPTHATTMHASKVPPWPGHPCDLCQAQSHVARTTLHGREICNCLCISPVLIFGGDARLLLFAPRRCRATAEASPPDANFPAGNWSQFSSPRATTSPCPAALLCLVVPTHPLVPGQCHSCQLPAGTRSARNAGDEAKCRGALGGLRGDRVPGAGETGCPGLGVAWPGDLRQIPLHCRVIA